MEFEPRSSFPRPLLNANLKITPSKPDRGHAFTDHGELLEVTIDSITQIIGFEPRDNNQLLVWSFEFQNSENKYIYYCDILYYKGRDVFHTLGPSSIYRHFFGDKYHHGGGIDL